jgi:hypothetical protein
VREVAARIAAVTPERRSRAAWTRGGVAGAGIVTAVLVAGLAAVGAVGDPLSYVSGAAARVTGEAGHKQASLQVVSSDPATSQYQTTTTTTRLSESSITVGGSASDSATLSGQTKTAGGTMTYTVYTDSGCSAGARSAGTVTVTNGKVPDSSMLTFNTPGTSYWQAVYSGDAANSGSSSACTSEKLTVAKASPQIGTSFNLTVNKNGTATAYDTAKLSGATPTAVGTVTYTVYTNNTCTAGGRSAGTVTVTNGVVPNSNALSFTTGTYYWVAAYSGDANNNPVSGACGGEVMTPKLP